MDFTNHCFTILYIVIIYNRFNRNIKNLMYISMFILRHYF
ncbi:hypothetical protein [Magpiepox virus 2]|nr:hypothetical protein [Magpiepox virus 2]